MRHERQIEVLERIADAGPHLRGLQAPGVRVHPASAYTDETRFAREQRVLFRDGPVFFALSCELPTPGAYRSASLGGVPVLVVRQADGSLRALVNACRHRAAPLVEPESSGRAEREFVCPYHAWTYAPDGELRARPLAEDAFEDAPADCNLHPLAVSERHGMIFVRPGGAEAIDADAFLAGAEDDLGAFGLERYVHLESRTRTWAVNWKLVWDTFCESYHIRTLHKSNIGPLFLCDGLLAERYGRHVASFGLRKTVLDEFARPPDERSLLPHGTLMYLLLPAAMVVHQIDHIEVWRLRPIDVRTTVATTSVFAPGEPTSDKARNYFIKNLDLLLDVTGGEDFPLMEQIQSNLESGMLPQLVFGRNEPPLILLHRAIDEALAAAD